MKVFEKVVQAHEAFISKLGDVEKVVQAVDSSLEMNTRVSQLEKQTPLSQDTTRFGHRTSVHFPHAHITGHAAPMATCT